MPSEEQRGQKMSGIAELLLAMRKPGRLKSGESLSGDNGRLSASSSSSASTSSSASRTSSDDAPAQRRSRPVGPESTMIPHKKRKFARREDWGRPKKRSNLATAEAREENWIGLDGLRRPTEQDLRDYSAKLKTQLRPTPATMVSGRGCHICHIKAAKAAMCCPKGFFSHSMCDSHLRRYWNLSVEDVKKDPTSWQCCPVCSLQCPCAACKRKLYASVEEEINADRIPAVPGGRSANMYGRSPHIFNPMGLPPSHQQVLMQRRVQQLVVAQQQQAHIQRQLQFQAQCQRLQAQHILTRAIMGWHGNAPANQALGRQALLGGVSGAAAAAAAAQMMLKAPKAPLQQITQPRPPQPSSTVLKSSLLKPAAGQQAVATTATTAPKIDITVVKKTDANNAAAAVASTSHDLPTSVSSASSSAASPPSCVADAAAAAAAASPGPRAAC